MMTFTKILGDISTFCHPSSTFEGDRPLLSPPQVSAPDISAVVTCSCLERLYPATPDIILTILFPPFCLTVTISRNKLHQLPGTNYLYTQCRYSLLVPLQLCHRFYPDSRLTCTLHHLLFITLSFSVYDALELCFGAPIENAILIGWLKVCDAHYWVRF